ncbi:MAG TPA: hypothetical protein VEZ55_03405, partial [Chitinophagaceae bacterium]|nr:hypothetical protein [Chitinophagaceae bacterium]
MARFFCLYNMRLFFSEHRTLFFQDAIVFLCCFITSNAVAQSIPEQQSEKIVVAGKQYSRSSLHERLWGRHYRKEWATPVKVSILYLDSLHGGLSPYKSGGGTQSNTLRLRNAAGKEYVLRSVDKTFGRALPEIYRGSFIERLIDDQVSIGHPYAALTIPTMAEAAKINHTLPVIGFFPHQDALGEYNDQYGNDLYLLEQRPDENWEEAENFDNAEKIIGTEKLLKQLEKDNDNTVDQLAFVRSRLFDLLIGDWSRHEDQWRWAKLKMSDVRIYTAIPRDRDQTYTLFDGFLLKLALSGAGLGHLQSFDHWIKDIERYTFPSRNIDRRLLNELTREEWLSVAKELQVLMTDEIIETAVKKLPPEVYPISGAKITAKLKSRRDLLHKYAEDYYRFLAKEVDVNGSMKKEFFHVIRLADGNTHLKIYKINKDVERLAAPFYSRLFKPAETKEIRLYGLSGADNYLVEGNVPKAIDLRIVGGVDQDSIIV